MTPVDYFKLHAKNLFRDYKTQYVYLADKDGTKHYTYKPKYFDVDGIFLDFDIRDEENFSLMKAQHLIAKMVGFKKWTELLKASKAELELAKLLFDNQHKFNIEEWDIYIGRAEDDNNTTFDSEARLEIFKRVFLNVEGHESMFSDYRLKKNSNNSIS